MKTKRIQYFLLRSAKTLLTIAALGIGVNWYQSRHVKSPSDLSCLEGASVRSFSGEIRPAKDFIKSDSLVYFWAPWCGVCKVSAPGLAEFMNDRGTNFVTIGLDDDEQARFETFIKESGLPKDKSFIGNETLRDCVGIQAYPTYYVISKSGERSLTSVGYTFKFMLWIRLQLAKLL